MKKLILATVLALAVGAIVIGDSALAQSGGSSSYTKNSTGSLDRPLPQAPVGHRQPRAGDVPSEKKPEQSERSGQPGRRRAGSQDQEHLSRMLDWDIVSRGS